MNWNFLVKQKLNLVEDVFISRLLVYVRLGFFVDVNKVKKNKRIVREVFLEIKSKIIFIYRRVIVISIKEVILGRISLQY